MNTSKVASTIAVTAFVLALFVGFVWLLNVGFDRQEVADCQTWNEQASQYPAFFLAKWQDEQCRAHGIIINAPVK